MKKLWVLLSMTLLLLVPFGFATIGLLEIFGTAHDDFGTWFSGTYCQNFTISNAQSTRVNNLVWELNIKTANAAATGQCYLKILNRSNLVVINYSNSVACNIIPVDLYNMTFNSSVILDRGTQYLMCSNAAVNPSMQNWITQDGTGAIILEADGSVNSYVRKWSGKLFASNYSDADFVSPTPPNNAHNNTNVTLNASSTTLINASFYFGITNPPTNNVLNINNTLFINWTTNATAEGTYYYYVQSSSFGVPTNTSIRTWVYDVSKPAFSLNSDNFFGLINNSNISRLQSNKQLSFTAGDNIGLYGYWINITNGTDGTGITKYSNLNTTLTGTSQLVNLTIPFLNWDLGNYTVYIEVADSHTITSISNYEIEKKPNELTFITDEKNTIQILTKEEAIVNAVKSTDRYSFNFDYAVKGETEKTFILKSPSKIRYMEDSKYKGHFVISNGLKGNWIDFEGTDEIPIIKKISDNEYQIIFSRLGDKIIFNSIGGLNVFNRSYFFNLVFLYPLNTIVYFGDQKMFNYTNEFNNKINIQDNGTINKILSQNCNCSLCSIVGTNCRVPITYYASIGILNTSILNVSVEYGLDPCINSFSIPNNATAINFTGLFEGNNSQVNISASGSLTYALHNSGTTYTIYPSITNRYETQYCIYPNWTQMDVSYSLTYNQFGATQTRNKAGSGLLITNALTTIPLYVLSSATAITITVTITDTFSNSLSGVDVIVSRNIAGIDYYVATAVTGDDGVIALYLDSTQSYTLTASKTGYTSSTKTINYPSTAGIYTMQLGTQTFQEVSYAAGISYTFSPSSSVLQNRTDYNFTFNLSSSYWNLTNCVLYLYQDNATGTLLSTQVGTFNSSICGVEITHNTSNFTNIISKAMYVLNGTSLYAYQPYQITSYSQGEYSLQTVLDDITNFTNLNSSGFGWQSRMFLAFIIIFALTALVSFKFNALINPEPSLVVQCALVLFFSYAGWLTIPSGTMGLNFADVWGTVSARQYAIFILDLLMTGGYIAWRHS